MLDYISFTEANSGKPVPESSLRKNCILFGAGHMGITYYDHISLKYNVIAYADNNPLLWGDIINSVPVIPVSNLKQWAQDGETDILVCTYYANESIFNQLKELKLNANIIIPKLLEFIQGDDDSLIDEEAFNDIIENSKKLYLQRSRNQRIRIVFVVHLLQLLSSYESIYEEMESDNRFDPVIVLSPRRDAGKKNQYFNYDSFLENVLQQRGYNYIPAYKDGTWIDLYSLNPDGIFYQVPYTFPQLPSIYRQHHYSEHIKILHTPYGALPTDDPGTLLGQKSGPYIDFLNSCWRLFLDKSNYDAFIDETSLSEKIVLSGTPKVDFYVRGVKNEDVYFKSKESKKILYTPTWMTAKGRSSFLTYHDYFLHLIEQDNIELVLRPHPMLIPELESTNIITKSELERIITAFKDSDNCLFDLYGDYRCALLMSDFAVMDISSLTYEYLPTGKPLILTMQGGDKFGVKQFIKEASYVAETREQLEYYMDMLISGEDPLREQRLEIINRLDGLFPNGGSNGAFIVNYIAENIRSI